MAFDNDEETVKLASELGEECSHVKDEDRCELSAKIMECSRAAISKRGLDPKKMFE